MEMWVVLPWALQLGRRGRATNLGEASPTWRGSDICALCFSQQGEIETAREAAFFQSVESSGWFSVFVRDGEVGVEKKYLATALPLFISNLV